MSEENNEENMKLVLGDLAVGGSVVVELEKGKAVADGKTTIGEWQMWAGSVEDTTVHKGRGDKDELVLNYTGDVVFFPSAKTIPKLEEAANGNDGVKVKITKGQKTSKKGKYTVYEVEKLSEGKPSDSSVTPTEQKFIDETKEVISQGFNITKDLFIKASQQPQYENKISVERATELYDLLN